MHTTLLRPIAAAALLATTGHAQRLIAVDAAPGTAQVYELSATTGARTPLAPMSPAAAIPAGLAYDAVTGRLFMTGTGTDSVYVVDVTNWQAQLIGAYGNSAIIMHGLEWDSSTNTLYGMSTHNSGLYTIDTMTGTATLVGVTGLTAAGSYGLNLGYDFVHDVMYMTSTNTDSLYTIDRATGTATLVGPMTGVTNASALAFDSGNLQMYLLDNLLDQLFTIDLATGTPTLIGPVGSSNLLGLAYLPETGRITRQAHACGPTTITPTGSPAPGSTVQFTLGGLTGLPFVGFDVVGAPLSYCSCTIGHGWQAVVGGQTVPFAIPAASWLVGVQIFAQGADLLGAGGCANPPFAVTDTVTVTIGW